MTSTRVRVGDVFAVQLNHDELGFGQVVAEYLGGSLYIVMFERTAPLETVPALSEITGSPVSFLALSHDAKIRAGDWRVIGNAPVQSTTPLPAYQEMVGGPNRIDVVDYSGKRRRRARHGEADTLPRRTLVAPMLLERALLASHGVVPWVDEYNSLRPPNPELTTAALFSG